MGEKIVVGPYNRGLQNNRVPFNIDNEAFPTLINAYQWRGRIKRKRGTAPLGRLQRYFKSTSTSYTPTSTITLDGSGNGNLITGWSLQTNSAVVPGTVSITDTVSLTVYTDPSKDGTLSPSGSINYSTGAIVIAAAASHTVSAIFRYYPNLPALGLRDLVLPSLSNYTQTLGFDTTYAYNVPLNSPYIPYDVSFYKNPATSGSYTQKTNWTPTSWNSQNYQLTWSQNYENAFWMTPGIPSPFVSTNIGMSFKPIVAVTVSSTTTASLQITAHGLTVGDFLFINEVATTTGINFQTGYVTTVTDANNVVVTFPNADIVTNGTGGIAQYLTRQSDTTKDCLRWYDGDPTSGSSTNPVLNQPYGWVNFCPPLSKASFSISNQAPAQYYLVGAKVIFPFKDRILFFGPVIQSSGGSPIYLQDTIIYSQNGTPYYTASFTGDPSTVITFNELLTPQLQNAAPNAFWCDQTGYGGFISTGTSQEITTVGPNEDVLIVGFGNFQARLVYTGNDLVPFALYRINSELGSGSTLSAVVMDQGVITRGSRGFIITSQVGAQRIDLDIPDAVFEIGLQNNGAQRIFAQRDYINEWIYFSSLNDQTMGTFPNQTLLYNYRDQTWALFLENYTCYGAFRSLSGLTWATVGNFFPTWSSWTQPWNASSTNVLQPKVIAGNQQGFIVFRDDGTNEAPSLFIQGISGSTITSPDHGLIDGDYIVIQNCLGTTNINNLIFQVTEPTENTFVILNAQGAIPSGTYLGNGTIKKMYVPYIQSKQFPVSWALGRKTRLGVQQYLLTETSKGQVSLLIFLSQNANMSPYAGLYQPGVYNLGPIVPSQDVINSSLIYSQILYTCPESTNLGLTPANINLQMVTASSQNQIWHRVNTSLIGDTVQFGITLSPAQMTDTTFASQFSEIELHGAILDVQPSMVIA